MNLVGVRIDSLSLREATSRSLLFAQRNDRPRLACAVSHQHLRFANEDPSFWLALSGADLVVGHGAVLDTLSMLQGQPLKEQVRPEDLARLVTVTASKADLRVAFWGRDSLVTTLAYEELASQHDDVDVGRFIFDDGAMFASMPIVRTTIKRFRPHVLVADTGSPLQERWFAKHLEELEVPLTLSVPGAFAALAGMTKPLHQRVLQFFEDEAAFACYAAARTVVSPRLLLKE